MRAASASALGWYAFEACDEILDGGGVRRRLSPSARTRRRRRRASPRPRERRQPASAEERGGGALKKMFRPSRWAALAPERRVDELRRSTTSRRDRRHDRGSCVSSANRSPRPWRRGQARLAASAGRWRSSPAIGRAGEEHERARRFPAAAAESANGDRRRCSPRLAVSVRARLRLPPPGFSLRARGRARRARTPEALLRPAACMAARALHGPLSVAREGCASANAARSAHTKVRVARAAEGAYRTRWRSARRRRLLAGACRSRARSARSLTLRSS